MARVTVKNKDLAFAMKIFGHISFETRKDMKKHEYYLRPGLKAKLKSKEAQRAKQKQKKFLTEKAAV
ncbi:MAG: 30S ribosomal protein S21 [Mycoplasmataceae bacterium]|jgi:small subunit ribosomal protein S21|nr:30S ribosomal protein S21 [Mycoplasmataceae bacterium]